MAMTELEKRAARMKWDPPAPGSDARKEMPKSAFLSPSTRTFPYKVLIEGQWVVSEPGLRSAISVANFRGNTAISTRASKMLEELTSDNAEHGAKDIANNFLAHYGILGMKWGIRRDRDSKTGLIVRERSEDYKETRALRRKSLSEMSNAELKRYVERMDLETRYKKIESQNISKGKAVANNVLKKFGDRAVDKAITITLDAAAEQLKRKAGS